MGPHLEFKPFTNQCKSTTQTSNLYNFRLTLTIAATIYCNRFKKNPSRLQASVLANLELLSLLHLIKLLLTTASTNTTSQTPFGLFADLQIEFALTNPNKHSSKKVNKIKKILDDLFYSTHSRHRSTMTFHTILKTKQSLLSQKRHSCFFT